MDEAIFLPDDIFLLGIKILEREKIESCVGTGIFDSVVIRYSRRL